jgi:DNA-binding GntR family transcriptional regulator
VKTRPRIADSRPRSARGRAGDGGLVIVESGRRKPLTVQAYEDIKGRILSLELRPGQFLNEATLCELTGLGRMPVHQAIHRLQVEGLIEVIPRKGLVVRSDSLNDILEMLEARMAIEPNVAAMAAERITKERVAVLGALLSESRGLVVDNQRAAFRVIDRAFHAAVGEGAGNAALSAAMRPLHERSELIWHLRIMPGEALEITQREHEAVLAAIVQRDASSAREAMQAHLLSLYKRVLACGLHAGNASPSSNPATPAGRHLVLFKEHP